MIRAVLDANVLISGLISRKGIPGTIIDAWMEGKFLLFISPQIIKEVIRVLGYPRIAERLEAGNAESLVKNLVEVAGWIKGDLQLKVLTIDPSDNIYLDCAVEAHCNYLVTGDREHFKEAGLEFEGVRIVNPRQFSDLLLTEELL